MTTEIKRKPSEICLLPDGRRVRFSMPKRDRDTYYSVRFTGPDKRRIEKSTKESSLKRARDAAHAIIRDEFAPKAAVQASVDWDTAIEKLETHTTAQNLRSGTVQQYLLAIGAFRKWIKEVGLHVPGPADVTPGMAEQFKLWRVEKKLSPRTIAGNLDNLSSFTAAGGATRVGS